MKVAVPKETTSGETRVSLSPDTVSSLISKDGLEILVEKDAGKRASFPDKAYEKAGAKIVPDIQTLYESADIVLKVQKPTEEEIKMMKPGTALISFLWALYDKKLVEQLKDAKITAFGMDAIPRISRAQKMDALSSMSSISGYKSVLIAANALGKYMPMMMTAAGTIPPSKVLILGAGVAGLQAIATARRLGAVVEAFDVRPAVKEQVESLGAKFVEVELEEQETETKGGYAKELSKESQQKQREAVHQHAKKADIVITTALIPGKPAPKLVTKEMVADMMTGSVIVDLAAEQGGNCELTKPGEIANENGVLIHGPLNVPGMMAEHASHLYSKNLSAFLTHLIKDGELNLDFEDEITQYATITHDGEIVSPAVKKGEM
ncbi:MAG TPA: Re/Si-specific NAD(P)(+) transhydrogenase subunit alpha [Balneolales bacterium]|nr:Re/Si-specific NAD(P)(+) transhydrogenase subunit alpha [Balneolales bacterium]